MNLEEVLKKLAETWPYTWQMLLAFLGAGILGTAVSFPGRVIFQWWINPKPNARFLAIKTIGDSISMELIIENVGRSALHTPLINIYGLPADATPSDSTFSFSDRQIWIYKHGTPLLPYGAALVHIFTFDVANCPEKISIKIFGEEIKPKCLDLYLKESAYPCSIRPGLGW